MQGTPDNRTLETMDIVELEVDTDSYSGSADCRGLYDTTSFLLSLALRITEVPNTLCSLFS